MQEMTRQEMLEHLEDQAQLFFQENGCMISNPWQWAANNCRKQLIEENKQRFVSRMLKKA